MTKISVVNAHSASAEVPQFMSLSDIRLGGKLFITPLHSIKADPTIRLIGGTFEGPSLNLNIWSKTNTGTSNVVVTSPAVAVSSGTTTGTATLYSTKRARFMVNSNNWFVAGIRVTSQDLVGVKRNFGVMDANNGMFFSMDAGVLKCVTRKNGVDTVSASNGSFNGDLGATVVLDMNKFSTFEIMWSAGQVLWMLGGSSGGLIHRLPAQTTPYSATFSPTIGIEVVNTTNTTDCNVETRALGVSRVGADVSRPLFKSTTTEETNTLKSSAGSLQRIVVNRKTGVGSLLEVWDSLSATGTKICTIELNNTLGALEYDLDFDNGLTYKTTGLGIDVTIIYE